MWSVAHSLQLPIIFGCIVNLMVPLKISCAGLLDAAASAERAADDDDGDRSLRLIECICCCS